jgi:catechol 2,3-dioxygenase-like lactoylglutathione lyase family enzyme
MFDLEKAKDFYVGFLGFQVDWEHALSPPHPCTCRCRAAIAAST